MFSGAHVLLYSKDADADRAFLRDTLGFSSVDAGRGWLIFRLPRSEVAVHPFEAEPGRAQGAPGPLRAELYLMCHDVEETIAWLEGARVDCAEVQDEGWGLVTSVGLPSGSVLGLYQPRHPTALDL